MQGRIEYRIGDPMDITRMPAYHPIPPWLGAQNPVELFIGRESLLHVLNGNIAQGIANRFQDKTQQDRTEREEILHRLEHFREWVEGNPNKEIFIGCYPAPEFEVVEDTTQPS